MGANGSTATTGNQGGADEFRLRVNLIATKFIMTQDFERLGSLSNEKYCSDLMILTRDLLAKKFSTKQINYLAMGNIKNESLLYISRNDLANIESGMRDKKMMCNGIARFYVRIAHVFAAIISTVSPNWKAGNAGAAPDFCKVRIDTLLNSARIARDEKGGKDQVLVQPTVCSLYASSASMMAQPGFPDLDPLYNDIYDFEKGVFNRRSSAMNSKYDSDLNMLFSEFTGSTNKPDTVKRFSDINIVSLAKRIPECGPHVPTAQPAPVPEVSKVAGQDPRLAEKIEIDRVRKNAEIQDKYLRSSAANITGSFASPPKGAFKSSGAYSDYVAHVKTMMSNADRSRNNLLKILDKMFLIVTIDSKPKITIHPTLTSDILDSLVNQTRDQILQLYVGCERDFYMGMKLLRVIVEEKMQENLEASLVKLKFDTRSSIKKVIEQKHQNVAASEQSGMFSQIKNAVFSSKPYDVSDDEDKIKKDTDKQKGVDAATEEENNAKEQLVILTKLIKDKTDEIENTRQMKAVIEKKREQAREVLRKAKELLASKEADQKTKGGVEGSSKELNEAVIKVRHDVDTAEIELKSADEEFSNTEKKIEELNNSNDEIKRNITDKQKQLEELTKKKTDLLLLKP
jgi:hypothetical protein